MAMNSNSAILKVYNAFKTLGWRDFNRQLLRMCDSKVGTLVGTDLAGNKYYENDNEPSGRNRWIDYVQEDFNASQVPPEWHAWLNHIRKDPPHVDPLMIANTPAWKTNHVENLTGTRAAFKTYSTVAPKFHAWQPKVSHRD